jgi:hypothetical protein
MSLLLRAAVFGAVAYFVTRSLSTNARARSLSSREGDLSAPSELQPGDNTVWPTSENKPATASAGPGA